MTRHPTVASLPDNTLRDTLASDRRQADKKRMIPSVSPEPLLTAAQMREVDRMTIAGGTPGLALMERAGLAVARAAMRLAGWPRPVTILCGPGNNGGDGFVAARLLTEAGWPVQLGLIGPRDALSGDAALAAARWTGPLHPALSLDLTASGLIIDALFGTGLKRDLTGETAALVDAVNRSGRPVLAVDLPSGLDSDSGQVRGAAVYAAATITFGARKPGHVLLPGRNLCGTVAVADIGLAPEAVAASAGTLWRNTPDLWRRSFPTATATQHKYMRGHALVIGGPAESLSAARLSAHAAMAAGAGLVTLAVAERLSLQEQGRPLAVMCRVAEDQQALDDLLADMRRNAVLIGPGLGLLPENKCKIVSILASERPCVLDADALTLFATEPDALFAKVMASNRPVVLTPHAGEFDRLFGSSPDDKVSRARKAAELSGAVLVFKGADTVIATPDGRAVIHDHASAALATAGTGDVLAGIIVALLAQGMPGLEAACAAVWLHGEAGFRAGAALIADDLPDAIQTTRAELILSCGSGRQLR